MNPTDRTPIILACLADILGERRPDDYLADQSAFLSNLYNILCGIASDPVAVARLWPATSEDNLTAQHILDILDTLDGTTDRTITREQQPNVFAVAAHLAAVAAALHVQGNDTASTAATLWRAASRLLGHDAAGLIVSTSTIGVTARIGGHIGLASGCSEGDIIKVIHDLRAQRSRIAADATAENAHATQLHRVVSEISAVLGFDPGVAGDLVGAVKMLKDDLHSARSRQGLLEVDIRRLKSDNAYEVDNLTRTHAAEVARLTDALATAKADLEEALRSPVSAGPTTSEVQDEVVKTVQRAAATPKSIDSIRKSALDAGARDCSVFVGPGEDMTIVVELRDGVSLDTVRAALNLVMPIDRMAIRPYTLREVRSPRPAPSECRQCGCPPPTLQRYACGLCGYPTPEGDANAGRSPQYPIDPAVRWALAPAVAKRRAEHASKG